VLTLIRHVPTALRRLVDDAAEVPANISEAATWNPADEVEPASVGMTEAGVQAIWRSVEQIYATGMHPGISVVLRRHGKVVLKRAIGHARGNGPDDRGDEKVAMTPTTPVCLFSSSKAIAAMLVHLLSERKMISLLDPVSHYIPAFGQNGKQAITIYQLLCHKAGIPTVKVDEDEAEALLLAPSALLARLYAAAPDRPGHHHAYHALTAGFVIADLVEKVTGQNIRRFLRENLTGPLGLSTMGFGAPKRIVERIARNYVTGLRVSLPGNLYLERAIGMKLEHAVRLSNEPAFYRAVIPAGNGVATADECSLFYECLLNGGEVGGVRVFDPLTVRRAIAEVGKAEIDRSLLVPIRYSAGMMLGTTPWGLYGPDAGQAFGHLGFTNNLIWADPERAISVAVLTTGKLILGLHAPYLLGLLSNVARHCTKLTAEEQSARLAATGMA
jgi:CubicO group peptidase (beta-lactamase class C family)